MDCLKILFLCLTNITLHCCLQIYQPNLAQMFPESEGHCNYTLQFARSRKFTFYKNNTLKKMRSNLCLHLARVMVRFASHSLKYGIVSYLETKRRVPYGTDTHFVLYFFESLIEQFIREGNLVAVRSLSDCFSRKHVSHQKQKKRCHNTPAPCSSGSMSFKKLVTSERERERGLQKYRRE